MWCRAEELRTAYRPSFCCSLPQMRLLLVVRGKLSLSHAKPNRHSKKKPEGMVLLPTQASILCIIRRVAAETKSPTLHTHTLGCSFCRPGFGFRDADVPTLLTSGWKSSGVLDPRGFCCHEPKSGRALLVLVMTPNRLQYPLVKEDALNFPGII